MSLRNITILACLFFGLLTTTVSANSTSHPEFGMTLYYPLDGTAEDQSGFGRDGTISGPVAAADNWGHPSGALNFNGSSDNVSMPASATSGLSRFTISVWIKTSESRTGTTYWTHPTIVGMATSGGGSGDFGIILNNGKPGFFGGLVAGTDSSYFSATSVNNDAWHHLAAVNDGVTVKLYIDGVLDAGGNIMSGLPLANTGFVLGKSNFAEPLACAGSMDELRIYDRALTAEEVALLAATAPATVVPLTITRTGSGSGIVTLAPSGITCSNPSCGIILPPASALTLSATPDMASIFAGWSGACSGGGNCALTLSAPAAVTAAFATWQNGLTAWYPFSGNANDASGNSNNATVNSAMQTTDRFGGGQRAYEFNGINSSIPLGGSSTLVGSRTLSIWVRPHANTGYGMPVVTAGVAGTADFIGVGATNGPCAFGATRLYLHHWGQACTDSSVNLTMDTWNHIVLVYDGGSTLSFYRNGAKVSSISGSLYNYGIAALTVGGNGISGLTTKPAFNGTLDDFAVYNRAMNDQEVLSLFYRQGIGSVISSPTDGGSVSGNIITVTGTSVAVTGRQVGLVEVSMDGGASWQSATDTSGSGSWATWSFPWQPTALGSFTIQARARDTAGYYELSGPAISVQVTFLLTPTTKTGFSTGSDFSAGRLDGVGMGTTGLQLTTTQQPLPFLWVPNLNDTVSKLDTASGRELGRYRTVPVGVNGVNSRTTVDLQGNVWMANRQAGSVVKIGLLENGQCIDRNGNGVIDTSRDTNGNGTIDSSEVLPWAADECVLTEVILIPGKEGNFVPGTYAGGYVNDYWNPGPRSVAVDKDNNVWVGNYGTQKFYYLNGTNGAIIRTVSVTGHSPYGAVMDAKGEVWSAGNGNNILDLDPKTEPPTVTIFIPGVDVYGITADHQGHIFTAGDNDWRLARISAATRSTEWSLVMPSCGRGLAVDSFDNIWIASSCVNKIFRYSNNGVLLAQISVPTSPTGVAIDSFDRAWAIGNTESIYRIDPTTNIVDLEAKLPGSSGHYAYSDMTGVISRTITTRIGTWSFLHDSGTANKPWGTVTWGADIPVNTSLVVQVRSSNDLVAWSEWETAVSGSILKATPDGRYLMVKVTLSGGPAGETPVLHNLTIAAAGTPLAQRDTTPPSGSILINSGALVTNNTSVLLTLAASDASGVVTSMRFSINGTNWENWGAFETGRNWTLTGGDGAKSVFVQYRDVAGNISSAIQATIELHTSIPVTTVTPPGGCFNSSQQVNLSSSEPGTIYFTTDGSDPTTSPNVQTYGGPIAVSTPTQLRYYAKDVWGYAETVKSSEFSFMTGTPTENITPAAAGIPGDGLKLWLRADSGTCLYLNDKLSRWYDLSGNGSALTGSGAVLMPNEMNGKTVVKFDGSHYYSQVANPTTTPYTILAISRQDGAARNRLISSASTNWLFGYWSGKEDQFHPDGWVYQPSTAATGDTYLYSGIGNGSQSVFYRDGILLAQNSAGLSAPGLLTLGGSGLYGEPSDGKVAEVIIYSRVLSDTERVQVENYLKTRYALAHQISVVMAGSGSGMVVGNGAPPAITCSVGTCSAAIPSGTTVTLTATPSAGSVFWGWTGLCSGTGPCSVTMDKMRSVTAVFDLLPHPESDMLLYYPLDGDATDRSGFGRNGTLYGTAPATNAWGQTGKALGLSGSSEYVQAPEFVTGGAFSVSAWIYVNNVATNWQRVMDFGSGSPNNNILIALSNSRMVFDVYQGSSVQSLATTDPFPQQQWVHVAVTNDGAGTGKIYWNGALKASGPSYPPFYLTRTQNYIGRSNWSNPYFSGAMDEFRFYGRELSRTEIDTLAAIPPPTIGTPLVVNIEGAAGQNSVSIAPAGIICAEETCSELLTTGSTVTLTAHADPSNSFTGWTGDCTGTTPTCIVNMSAARNVTASFDGFHTGLVAFYPFSGNADDASGNGLHGTVNGPVLTDNRFGAPERAYLFDGVNDSILVGDPVPSLLQIQKEISLEAWIYVTEYPSELGLIVGSQYDGTTSGASIFLDGRTNPDGMTVPAGHIHFQIGNGSWHTSNSSSPIPLNQWVHIVATRRAYEDARIYVNGVPQTVASLAWTGPITYNSSWFAMGIQKGMIRPFKGKMDDVRIYNRALQSAEVTAHYQQASVFSLAVTIAGDGGGNVTDSQGKISCITGTCRANLQDNSQDILYQYPDMNSLFGGWSGSCTNGSGDCTVTMSTDRAVTATFNYVKPAKVGAAYYDTLELACYAAASGSIVQARAFDFGSLMLDMGKSLTIMGGYDLTYTTNSGYSSVGGLLTIKNGALTVDKLIVK